MALAQHAMLDHTFNPPGDPQDLTPVMGGELVVIAVFRETCGEIPKLCHLAQKQRSCYRISH
jgi:hypothetical protein